MKKRQNSYRPSKISTSLLDQLVKFFRFEPSKTRREILKQRRGTAASFYSISLKDQYEPFEDYEDYLIEDILQRSFSDNSLEKQDYALDFDLDALYRFWRDKN